MLCFLAIAQTFCRLPIDSISRIAFPAIILLAWQLATTAEDAPVVMFTSAPMRDTSYLQDEGVPKLVADSLYRELGRQAILLTVREEFGLATRDEALHEPVDRDSPHLFVLEVEAHYHKHLLVRVVHQGKEIYKTEIKAPISAIEAYHLLAAQLEPATRADLVEVFEQVGYRHRPNEKIDPEKYTEIDYEVENQLLTMNHLAQVRALRTLYQVARTDGESIECLAGLVRGYANLSQLTLSTMDVRAQVFAARSLLYAERMEALAPGSPLVSWHKAYANTLLGYPTKALLELEEARERQVEQTAEEPSWTTLLEYYCYYFKEELEQLATDETSPHRELAALLMFRASQQSASDTLLTQVGTRALKIIPTCLCISDVMTLEAGVGLGHQMTAFAPQAHTQQIAGYLPTWEDLPAPVYEFVNEGEDSARIYGRAHLANLLVAAAEHDR